MGERFSGGGESYYEWKSQRERDPNIEKKEHYDAIQRLLARLVEGGGDLASQVKKGLRQQVQTHLAALGLNDLSQLAQISSQLHDAAIRPPTPPNFPSRDELRERLLGVISSAVPERLPTVWQNPTASEIAEFGQTDWSKVVGRGQDTLDYVHGLGKVLSSEFSYTTIFTPIDPIVVEDRWRIENGRHRTLALRALGSDYVRQQGMDRWVKAVKNDGNF